MVSSAVLIGPQCMGKSSVARELSELTNFPIISGDLEFTKRHGEIADYVKENGWLAFRRAENHLYRDLVWTYSEAPVVLDVGGGAVANDHENAHRFYQEENTFLLRNFGTVVLLLYSDSLEETATVLAQRRDSDFKSLATRPQLADNDDSYAAMFEMLSSRLPRYKQAAHMNIYTKGFVPKQVGTRIYEELYL